MLYDAQFQPTFEKKVIALTKVQETMKNSESRKLKTQLQMEAKYNKKDSMQNHEKNYEAKQIREKLSFDNIPNQKGNSLKRVQIIKKNISETFQRSKSRQFSHNTIYIQIKTQIHSFSPIYLLTRVPLILQEIQKIEDGPDDHKLSPHKIHAKEIVLNYGSQLLLNSPVKPAQKSLIINQIKNVVPWNPESIFFEIIFQGFYLTLFSLGIKRQQGQNTVEGTPQGKYESIWVIETVDLSTDNGLKRQNYSQSQQFVVIFNMITSQYLGMYMTEGKIQFRVSREIKESNIFQIRDNSQEAASTCQLVPLSAFNIHSKKKLTDQNRRIYEGITLTLLPVELSQINVYYQLYYSETMMKHNPSLPLIHQIIDELIGYNIPEFLSLSSNGLVSNHIQQLLAEVGISQAICSYLIEYLNKEIEEMATVEKEKNIYLRYLASTYGINFRSILSKDIRNLCFESEANSQIFYPLITALLRQSQSSNELATALIGLIEGNPYFIRQFRRLKWFQIILDKYAFTASIDDYETGGQLLTLMGIFCSSTSASIPNKYLVMNIIESMKKPGHQEYMQSNSKNIRNSLTNININMISNSYHFPMLKMFTEGLYVFVESRNQNKIEEIQLRTFLDQSQELKCIYEGQLFLISSLCEGFMAPAIKNYLPTLKSLAPYCFKANFPTLEAECRSKTLEAFVKAIQWKNSETKFQFLNRLCLLRVKKQERKRQSIQKTKMISMSSNGESNTTKKMKNRLSSKIFGSIHGSRNSLKSLDEKANNNRIKQGLEYEKSDFESTMKKLTSMNELERKSTVSSQQLLMEMYENFENYMIAMLFQLKQKNIETYDLVFCSNKNKFFNTFTEAQSMSKLHSTKKKTMISPQKQGKVSNYNESIYSDQLLSWLKLIEISLKNRLLGIMKKKQGAYMQYLKKMFENANVSGKNKKKNNFENPKSEILVNQENQYVSSTNLIVQFIDKLIAYNPVYDYYLEQIKVKRKKVIETGFNLKNTKNKIIDRIISLRTKFKKEKMMEGQLPEIDREQFDKANYIQYIFEEAQEGMLRGFVNEDTSRNPQQKNAPYIIDYGYLQKIKGKCFEILALVFHNISEAHIEQSIENLEYLVQNPNNYLNNKFELVDGFKKYPNTSDMHKIRIIESWYLAGSRSFFNNITTCLRYIYDQTQIYVRGVNTVLLVCQPHQIEFYNQVNVEMEVLLKLSESADSWFRGPILYLYRENIGQVNRCLDNILTTLNKMPFNDGLILIDYQKIVQNCGILSICRQFFTILIGFEQYYDSVKGSNINTKTITISRQDISELLQKFLRLLQFYCYRSLSNSHKVLLVLAPQIFASKTLVPFYDFLVHYSVVVPQNYRQSVRVKAIIITQYIELMSPAIIDNIVTRLPISKCFLKSLLYLSDVELVRAINRLSKSLLKFTENSNSVDNCGTFIEPLLSGNNEADLNLEVIEAILQDSECVQYLNLLAFRLIEISNCGAEYLHWYYDLFLQRLFLKENQSNIKFKSKILQNISSDIVELHSSIAVLLYNFYWNDSRLYENKIAKKQKPLKKTDKKKQKERLSSFESERSECSVSGSEYDQNNKLNKGRNIYRKKGNFHEKSLSPPKNQRKYGFWLEEESGKLFIIDYIYSEAMTSVSSLNVLAEKDMNLLKNYIEYYLFDLMPLLRLLPREILSELMSSICKKLDEYLLFYQSIESPQKRDGSKGSLFQTFKTIKQPWRMDNHELEHSFEKINILIQKSEFPQDFQPRINLINSKIQEMKHNHSKYQITLKQNHIPPKQDTESIKLGKKALKKWCKARHQANFQIRKHSEATDRFKMIEDIFKLQLQYENSEIRNSFIDEDKQFLKVINSSDIIHKLLTTSMNLQRVKIDLENQTFILKQIINWLQLQRQKNKEVPENSRWKTPLSRSQKKNKSKSFLEFFFGNKDKNREGQDYKQSYSNKFVPHYDTIVKQCRVDHYLSGIIEQLIIKVKQDQIATHVLQISYLLQIVYLVCDVYEQQAVFHIYEVQFDSLLVLMRQLRKTYFFYTQLINQYYGSFSIQEWNPLTVYEKQEGARFQSSKNGNEHSHFIWSPLLTVLRIIEKILDFNFLKAYMNTEQVKNASQQQNISEKQIEIENSYDEKYENIVTEIVKIQYNLLLFLAMVSKYENTRIAYDPVEKYSSITHILFNSNTTNDLVRLRNFINDTIMPKLMQIGGESYDEIYQKIFMVNDYYRTLKELWR